MKLNRLVICLITLLLVTPWAWSQDFEYLPGSNYDPQIPTLEKVVGHDWGEKITSPAEIVYYLKALSEASPRVSLVRYGETWEGRGLYCLVVASEENHSRIEEIRKRTQQLADPRSVSEADAGRLQESLPAVAWLSYGIHGNEISSPEAALLTAYHLAAAQGDELASGVLENCVVIIDPSQNPDGRNRFVTHYRSTRGQWPDADPQSAEHNEAWPGGRTNHYLFDLNRDWFPLTQPESRGRVRAYLDWFPVVFVDLHEMGSNSTYYFPPAAKPRSPEVTDAQIDWLKEYGRNNAGWFDRMKFDYFTREVFDAFYPGYGVSWPSAHGSIGMTYEQASTRGLKVQRNDETVLHLRDAIQHHFISSLSTLETTARNRSLLLKYFYDYRRSAIEEGASGEIKEFIVAPGTDPGKAGKLVSILMEQGIEVKRTTQECSTPSAADYFTDEFKARTLPAGSYVISLAQPAKRMAKTLLAQEIPMPDEFIKEQVRRNQKRQRDQIYDITTWSLPLLYDVEAYRAGEPTACASEVLTEPPSGKGTLSASGPVLAYLVKWGNQAATKALAELFRRGIRVFSAGKGFQIAGESYPAGSLIIKVKNNPDNLSEVLDEVASSTGAEIVGTQTSWMDEGVNFGSGQVAFLKKPRVAMFYRSPTASYSVGWTRYLLEQSYGYPVTLLDAMTLSRLDLSKYNVLVLPSASGRGGGGYERAFGEAGAGKIRQWVREGGTLIALGEATRWLTGEKVGLLSTEREFRTDPSKSGSGSGDEKESRKEPAKSLEKTIVPEKEMPTRLPGALLRILIDPEHWLGFGSNGGSNVLVSSGNIYTPLKLDKGINVARYVDDRGALLVSGFGWEHTLQQMAGKSFLMVQRNGQGEVVAFSEDPNYRAFQDGLNQLFMNAVLFGPSR